MEAFLVFSQDSTAESLLYALSKHFKHVKKNSIFCFLTLYFQKLQYTLNFHKRFKTTIEI